MKKILCRLGLHNWERNVQNNVRNDKEILCRIYDRCRWCKKWSWIKHFQKFELLK